MICKRCLVSGKVQGVFYRASTARKARELGISGYAMNLPDGRVEVLACGDAEAVNTLCEWLWEGPPAAEVADVEIYQMAETDAPTDFVTR
ncbi:MAG TPA: acylphosphatase [Gammaproteobacteria bacterium]|jgi:acylphosphatase|nr:acylphosphatase [Gammaproteobacteria bacterium]